MSKVAKWIFPAAGGKDGIIGTAKAVFGFATGNWGMVASGVAQVAGLGKKKQAAQDRQANVTSLTIGEVPREAVLGQTCTGGSLIDVFSFGGKYGTDTVTYCVALADHAIDGIVGYFVNDRYYPWVGEGLQAAFSNKLSFHFRQATVDGHEPPLHVRNAGAGWTVNDRLAGIAHIWIDTHLDDKVWSQGWPKFKFVLRGLRVFDPRFDPALGYSGPNPQTWENRASHKFSTNAVLLRYAVARGIYAEGHQGEEEHLLIGRGLSAEEAPPARIIAAANLCDESVNGKPRYAASGVISAAEDFATVEEMFATAMAGLIVQREGGVEVEPGQAKAAVVTITDADLVTGEPVTFSHFLPDGSDGRINTVVPRYIEPAQGYKDHAGPVRRSIPDIQKDRGPREMTLVQLLVTDVDQSDRNAEIARLRSRCERRSQIVLPPAFAALEEGDWIAWKSDRYHEGATVRYLVESFALNEKWRNSLVLSEIAASVFGGTDPVEVVPVPPPPPPVIDALSLSGVVIEAITLAGDTSTLPAIRFRWDVTVTDTAIIAVRAEVRRVGETEAAPTRFEDVAKGEMIVTNGVGPDLALEARLVPIGNPSRPVVPTTWTTVSTATIIAGDTTHLNNFPVSEITDRLQSVEAVAASTQQGVADLEEVFGDTVSAAESALLAGEHANLAVLKAGDASAAAAASNVSAGIASTKADDAGNSATAANVAKVAAEAARDTASGQATASATSAASAAASATTAGEKATASEASATQAATRAGEALTYRNQSSASAADAVAASIAAGTSASNAGLSEYNAYQNYLGAAAAAATSVEQASSASASAAAASISANLAASVGGGSLNLNPNFANYPTGTAANVPPNWAGWGSMREQNRVVGRFSPWAFQQHDNVGDVREDCGIAQDSSQNPGFANVAPSYYVLEADIRLDAGGLRGAGMYVYCDGGGDGAMLQFGLEPDVNGYVGHDTSRPSRSFRKLIRLNNVGNGRLVLHAMTSWAGGWGVSDPKYLTWDRCAIRPATAQEVAAGIVLPQVQANLAITADVAADAATRLSTVRFDVTGGADGDPFDVSLKAGPDGSDASITATRVRLRNIVNGQIVDALTVEDGKAKFSGDLSVQSGASGERTVITTNAVRVFDGNNIERVTLGRW